MKNSLKNIKIYHRLNRLRLKAGLPLDDNSLGFIDPAAIELAQRAIAEKEPLYAQELEQVLVKLESTWDDLKKETNPKKIKKNLHHLYTYAHNIKDLAETYHYALMNHFGESLRDFCERIDLSNDAHHTIVQAHIDVMWVAFNSNIKDDGGPQAQDLKLVVATAIKKYS